LQFLQDPPVALPITVDFPPPEFDVRRGFGRARAIVAVPKTAVDEYGAMTTSEDYIRTARQVFRMKPVPVPEAEKKTPYEKLRQGVFAVNGGHCATSLLRCQSVHRNRPSALNDKSGFAVAMFFIVVDVAECNEIVGCVFAFVLMMVHMVQLKHLSRIFR
jgi:hypothetical protein